MISHGAHYFPKCTIEIDPSVTNSPDLPSNSPQPIWNCEQVTLNPILLRAIKLLLGSPQKTVMATAPGLALLIVPPLIVPILMQLVQLVPSATAQTVASIGMLWAIMILRLAALALIAVGWHRYVLLDAPVGFACALPQIRALARYLFAAFIITALLLGLTLTTFMLRKATTDSLFVDGEPLHIDIIWDVAILTLSGWMLLRLGAGLPAAAIGTRVKLRDSWAATAPLSATLAKIAFVFVGFSYLLDLIVIQSWSISGKAAYAFDLASAYVAVLISASLLTTLYGTLVQGRTL